MIIIPIAALVAILALSPKPPQTTSPETLALWADCSPPKISYAISQRIEYKEVLGWESGLACLSRGYGDCKCMAITAKEIMEYCQGYTPRILVLKSVGKPKYHAVTIYVNPQGKRGFIDGGSFKEFPAGTDWNEVIKHIGGGPWEVSNNE